MTAALGVAIILLIAAASIGIRIFEHISTPHLDLTPGLEPLRRWAE